MSRRPGLCVAGLAVILALQGRAVPADDTAQPTPETGVSAQAPSGTDQRPARWIAAYGLDDPGDVVEFVAAGFNCALVEVPLSFDTAAAKADTRQKLRDADSLRALLDACAEKAVSVFVGVRGVGVPPQGPDAMSPGSASYLTTFGTAVFRLTKAVGEHRAVAAWFTPRRASEYLSTSPADFTAYLRDRYGDVPTLAKAWGRQMRGFDDATVDEAIRLASGTDIGVNTALLDIAAFRVAAYHELLVRFHRAFATYDAKARPVFAGEEPTFWGLADIPAPYVGGITGIYPAESESDTATQNAAAVDVCRAGGHHKAFFGVQVTEATTPLDLRRWASAAFARGAWGLAISDWRSVAGDKDLVTEITRIAAQTRELGEYQPQPRVAFIYQPWHTGILTKQGRPVYGCLNAAGWPCEPMALLRLYSRGSRWGGMDVIPAREADLATLSRYRVVIAPQLYSVPEPLAAALWDYARGGGVLYCDLGAGAYESGSFHRLPQELVPILGAARVSFLSPGEFDGTVREPTGLLPSLEPGTRTQGAPFRGLIGDARPASSAAPVILIRARREAMPLPDLVFAGIFATSVERGTVLFATGHFLGEWTPAEPTGSRFWGDLLRLGATVENLKEPAPVGGTVDMREGLGSVVAANSGGMREQVGGRLSPGGPGALVGCLMLTGTSRPAPEFIAEIPAGGLLIARGVPVTVRTAAALLCVSDYSDTHMALQAAPPDASYTLTPGKGVSLEGGTEGPLELEIRSGDMPVLPNEEFDLTTTAADGRPKKSRAIADPDGVVRISLEAAGCVSIEMRQRGRAGGGGP